LACHLDAEKSKIWGTTSGEGLLAALFQGRKTKRGQVEDKRRTNKSSNKLTPAITNPLMP
jgi:hypothetical protein